MLKILNVFLIRIQYILPKRFISYIFGKIASIENIVISQVLIRIFIKVYNVSTKNLKEKNLSQYKSFNNFFSRKIVLNKRKIIKKNNYIISPADGILIFFGNSFSNKEIKIKNTNIFLKQLLDNDIIIEKFSKKYVFIVYLRPQDYHRVHMPLSGHLIKVLYVSGTLFSVKKNSIKNINNVFLKNERYIYIFKNKNIIFAIIMIGALNVGNIKSKYNIFVDIKDLYKKKIFLNKGEELGYFIMGSTVITCFNKNIQWENLVPNQKILFTELIAKIN